MAVVREPLFWAASAAFAGNTLGLVGTVGYAGVMTSFDSGLSGMLFATAAQSAGEALAASSLFGVPALLGESCRRAGRRAAVVGGLALAIFIITAATAFFYLWYANTGRGVGSPDPFPRVAEVSFWVSIFASPVVVAPFAVAALWARHVRLGVLLWGLCVLCFPFGVVWIYLDPLGTTYESSAAPWLLGIFGTGIGIPEGILWIIFGVMLLTKARESAYRKAWNVVAEECRDKALRLYERGLGDRDLAVVDQVVSEDLRDLRNGFGGRLAMERLITGLWETYPDLSVSVEAQEAERDVVRTRVMLSGTDRGGVMWYPPTHRPVVFSAEFSDRFVHGKLVEHAGEADTEELLRQLGHRRESEPGQPS